MKKLSIFSVLAAFVFCISAEAQTKPIVVKVNEVKADVQPTMWGVFFEDINLGADGGLYAELVIADNGIGFRDEFAEKIFVVFQRLNNRELYSGNGIGLSLCKKIVENHRGKIYATAQPGEGAVFTVLLPQKQN